MARRKYASVLDQYDRDAYEPIYASAAATLSGKPKLIGVKRRAQDEIDRRRAERAAKADRKAA